MYFTGLPSLRATAKVIISSGVCWSLPPKPPPTSGAMTRIFDSGTPVVAASANRRMCGIWVAHHTVICSPVGSTTVERGSMKAGMSRCWRYSRSITIPSPRAFSMAASTLPPVPASAESKIHSALLLVPRSGCASTVSLAASLRSSAAGSSSYSTSTSSAASRASAAVRATTTATISPAKVTRSDGIGTCGGVTWSGVIAQALMQAPSRLPRSAPVKHGDDVGEACWAASVSMLTILAWAKGLRTIARCSIPGRVRLSVQRVRPVMRRWSSLRRRSRPISRSGFSAVAVISRLRSRRRAGPTSRCCGSRCNGTGCPRCPRRTSSSVGLGFSLSRSTACMIMPGVQKPHWRPWHSRKDSCTGCRSSPSARPSIVVTS